MTEGRAWLSSLLSFPNPVNDYAARLVAGMVVLMGLGIVVGNAFWLLPLLAYGFLARVLAGPKLSPAALLATRVLVPALGNPYKPVGGPPKRFAQAIGLVFSVAALLLYFGLGLTVAATVAIGVLVVFASLEAVLGFCAGCFVFGYLMRWGLVPSYICEACNNVGSRPQATAKAAR